MRYAFSRRELQFLNKNIFNNGLHGIPKPLTPFVTMKQRLINNNIISLNDNKELQIESVYKSLFDDWCKMDHIIEFKNEEYDLDIVLYNDIDTCTIYLGDNSVFIRKGKAVIEYKINDDYKQTYKSFLDKFK